MSITWLGEMYGVTKVSIECFLLCLVNSNFDKSKTDRVMRKIDSQKSHSEDIFPY